MAEREGQPTVQSVPVAERLNPLVEGDHSLASVTDKISAIVLTRPTSRGWLLGLSVGFVLVMLLFAAITKLLYEGVGVWGLNQPVGWGFAIINFVWWIGIGHAGTLISAILLLLKQEWRTSINRFAEAMTLFAVVCAGLFPLLHVGRPWLAYWLLPYPNTMELWPQFRSPLVWDVFAVSTYGTVSLLFWYVGLIPDLATLRDRAQNRFARMFYGLFAMGWRGAARHWERYETAYLLLAGLATPLVVSVHTVVSFDFAVGIIPGWHATVMPPYFVAGAIYSGFAMVMTLAIPLRAMYGLKDFITMRHLQNMAKIMLATGLIVAYGYAVEIFCAWYSGSEYEGAMVANRVGGPFAWAFWSLIVCNVLIPQALWSRRVRSSTLALFLIAIVINVGMWLERFVIVVTSLSRDYLPSSWKGYSGTFWDWALYLGTIGLFLTLILLFIRFLPMISIFEMRTQVPADPEAVGEEGALMGLWRRRRRVDTPFFGFLAEFADGKSLLRACERTRAAGYRSVEAYTPLPMHDVSHALGYRNPLPFLVLLGGIAGGVLGFGMQWYASVASYPLNVGGRPLNSWPAFLVVTFELTILFAAGTAVLGMLALNGLPRPHHPVFSVPAFELASRNRFFLLIMAHDPLFDVERTRRFLDEMDSLAVLEVPNA